MTDSAERDGGLARRGASVRLPRVPDFFLVGHPKSGTTALYEMLRRHPQIFMPDFKEPRYFARRSALALPGAARHRRRPGNARGVPGAVRRRRSPGQIAGEASTAYIWSTTAAGAIAAGAARREDHRDPARAGELPALAAPAADADPRSRSETLRKALAIEDARREGKHVPRRSPLAPGAALLRARPLRRAAASATTRRSRPSRC